MTNPMYCYYYHWHSLENRARRLRREFKQFVMTIPDYILRRPLLDYDPFLSYGIYDG